MSYLVVRAGRPVQVTQDLAGFWTHPYPALKYGTAEALSATYVAVSGAGKGSAQRSPAAAQSPAFRTYYPVRRKPWDSPWRDGPWRASPGAGGGAQAASVGVCTTRHGAQLPHAAVANLEPVEVCPGVLFLILLGLYCVA